MASGLLALLDDVAALVKLSAASLDDVPAQVAKTTGKVSGIVIDDAAVTPKYVVGLDPARELSIIYRIAKRSLINKVIYLAPAALLLGFFAPWAIQPILMLGGAYLCYEGYEKVHALFTPHHEADNGPTQTMPAITPEQLEDDRVKGAVRTDLILSSEIIAITYSTISGKDLVTQIIVMLSVAIAITVGVYGFVGLVVKADDIGVHLAKSQHGHFIRRAGRGLVTLMPRFLAVLGYVGTAAMLWVGAGIIAHGIPVLHHGLENVQALFEGSAVGMWLANALTALVGGLVLGALIDQVVRVFGYVKGRFIVGGAEK